MNTLTVLRVSTQEDVARSEAPSLELSANNPDDRLAGWLRGAPWRAEEPFPGTVAARHPEPAVVTAARVMAVEGFEVCNVIAEIEHLGIDRTRLEEAKTYWVRQLSRGRSDDFAGHRVLQALEGALRA